MSLRSGCAVILITAALCTGIFTWWVKSALETPFYGGTATEAFVEIPRRAGTARIAAILVENGVLREALPFSLYIRWTESGKMLKAGEYRFSVPATPVEIANRLLKGDVYFHSVTVPEGLDGTGVIETVIASGLGSRSELERAFRNASSIRDLAPGAETLEGYLFPDTYRFPRRTASSEILQTMVERFREQWKSLTSRYPVPPGRSPHQIVTIASMIEKEVGNPDERARVGSVLLNRLAIGMPLGCDPTVIYALKLKGSWDGNIRKADLSISSPYNTYVRPGLPPGPIANPGARSLEAAIAPEKTEFLYFVSRNDGTHIFSKDYRTHQSAVARFQKHIGRSR